MRGKRHSGNAAFQPFDYCRVVQDETVNAFPMRMRHSVVAPALRCEALPPPINRDHSPKDRPPLYLDTARGNENACHHPLGKKPRLLRFAPV